MNNNLFNQIFNTAFNQPFFQQNVPFDYMNQNFNPSSQDFEHFQNNFHHQNNHHYQNQFSNQQQQGDQQYQQQNIGGRNQFNQQQNQNKQQDKEKQTKKQQVYDENSAQYWKMMGNKYYQQNQYEKAIQYYTKAIEIDDSESIYYANRAKCYRQTKNYDKALKDAIQAIELDDKSIKAHLICGQSLAQVGKFENKCDKIEKSISKMTKAFTLCSGQNKKMYEKELATYILRAKKLLWYKQQDINKNKEQQQIIIAIESINKNEFLNDIQKQSIIDQLQKNHDQKFMQDFDIPDYLCCKITLEIMEDPHITSVGTTYEGSVLYEHIQKNGSIDPFTSVILIYDYTNQWRTHEANLYFLFDQYQIILITLFIIFYREPIEKTQIVRNLGIKQAIQNFLEKNPWAFEYQSFENYMDIDF